MSEKRVQTTAIEKKYKDKKTGEYKTLTINYAKVKDRLTAFWEENPSGSIVTKPQEFMGKIMFQTEIMIDKGNPQSRTATGTALQGTDADGEKVFEKLETISVGRALALLGYAVSGEVASSEEMEEFHKYREEKRTGEKLNAIENLEEVKDLETLKTTWMNLKAYLREDKDLVELKDKRKEELK